MKIVTYGQNPYLLTAKGRIHSYILEHLSKKTSNIASISYDYDTSYFVPEKIGNNNLYCYKFLENKYIPVFPHKRSKDSASAIYDILEKLKPDIFVVIDNYENGFFIQAIKTFLPDLKILWILTNDSLPINENLRSVVEYADCILCTNQFTFDHILSFYDHQNIHWKHIGVNLKKFYNKKNNKKTSIFCSASNTFSNFIPVPFQICEKNKDLHIYLHTDIYSEGFYNLDILKERFNIQNNIEFPEKITCSSDGFTEEELNAKLNENMIFLSTSMSSSSSAMLFQALSAGCLPIINSCYSDKEILFLLKDYVPNIEYFMYENIPFLAIGEKWNYMPNIDSIEKKIKDLMKVVSNIEWYEKTINGIQRFIKGYDTENFVNIADELINDIKNKEFFFTG